MIANAFPLYSFLYTTGATYTHVMPLGAILTYWYDVRLLALLEYANFVVEPQITALHAWLRLCMLRW
jgi:hypothetical protein